MSIIDIIFQNSTRYIKFVTLSNILPRVNSERIGTDKDLSDILTARLKILSSKTHEGCT